MVEKLKDMRILTPVLAALSPILLSIIGWFVVTTLTEIKTEIKETNKATIEYRQKNEGRLSSLETHIKFIDSRIDRVERIRKN